MWKVPLFLRQTQYIHKRALRTPIARVPPIKYTLERSHVESHWTAIFQQGGSIITDKAYRLRRQHTHTHTHTHIDKLATARCTDMRNCFIGHCLCTQLLYHSFTEGGVSLTTNQFEAHLAPPRPRRPCEHRVPLSGQCFVSPGARRPAVPEAEPPRISFSSQRNWAVRDPELCRETTRLHPRGSFFYFAYMLIHACSEVWTICATLEGAEGVWINLPYAAFCNNRELIWFCWFFQTVNAKGSIVLILD